MHFVQARNITRADRKPGAITLVVIHTAECAEVASAAENLQTWTAGPDASQASWHYAVDSDSVTQSCLEKDIAWHAGPVNDCSVGIEHAGRASQSAAQWADDYSIAMLERSAELVADICRRHGIPVERLSADDLKTGKRAGICGHVDVTNGLTGGKGHRDPGPEFPWDWYLERVRSHVDGRFVEPPLVTPEIANVGIPSLDFHRFVDVECEGVAWKVAPIYIAPVGIGEAAELARRAGCVLPSPALVDAIWRAADLRISPAKTIQQHNGSASGMNASAVYQRVVDGIEEGVGGRSLGTDFQLVAGPLKDVVQDGTRLGLYGMHVDDDVAAFEEELKARAGFTVLTYPSSTPGPGRVVQPAYFGHLASWKDYSQGLRLVRRA